MASLSHLQEEVTPREVADLHARGDVDLVDVREPYEHDAGHVEGDRHVTLPELSAAAADMDRERAVVFYCRSGAHSAMATQAFRASGFEAFNMSGGLLAWADSGLPLAPEGGTVADH